MPGSKRANNFHLLIDIYEITDNKFDSKKFIDSSVITQEQYDGRYVLLLDKEILFHTYKLDFKYVVNYIVIYITSGKITEFKLLFDGIDSNITISDMFMCDNKYIIPFTKSLNKENIDLYGINFSEIKNATLILYIDDKPLFTDEYVYISAINYNAIIVKPNDFYISCSS